MVNDCIFCKIVNGEIPSFKIFEDDEFIAFLDLFPNTEGQTVVITKKHYNSYAFELEDQQLCKLITAAKKVGKLLDTKLGAERTCMVTEGYGVDHVHVKLFPKKPGEYEGSLSTKLGPKADEEKLKEIQDKITGNLL